MADRDPSRGEQPLLSWLQDWYLSNCDDEWEHSHGVRIDTLDNPGWTVQVDLASTRLQGRPFDPVRIERTEHDWLHVWVARDVLEMACGPTNLVEALDVFRTWVEGQAQA